MQSLVMSFVGRTAACFRHIRVVGSVAIANTAFGSAKSIELALVQGEDVDTKFVGGV